MPCSVPRIVKPGETLSSTKFERRGGGKGANQALAVARAGAKVVFLGAIGTDGEWLKATLAEAGVDVGYVVSDDQVRQALMLLVFS